MLVKMLKIVLPLILLIAAPFIQATHLILYFDMNKTLIASDKNASKTTEQLILEEIASRVHGRWDNTLKAQINYLDYVNYHLIPNPDQQPTIREKQIAQICCVLSVLQKTHHPDYLDMKRLYERAMLQIEKMHQNNTEIFPSFYRLIEHLQNNKIDYTLVIRTFGAEGKEIVEELNQHLDQGFHPIFLNIQQNHLKNSLDDIVRQSDRPLVIQDDFNWWKTHDKQWQYGKPFPIHNSSSLISLFFDDNAKINPHAPQQNIVSPYDAITHKPIDPSIAIEQGLLIPVNMLDALLDEEYYIKQLPSLN